MEITFRTYQPGDSEGIAALFSSLPYKRDTAYWTWMYRLLNTPSPLIALAVATDKGISRIVGYTATAVKTLSVSGKQFTCGHSIHLYIDPAFRKYEYIISELSEQIHQLSREQGIKCILGFPNAVVRNYVQQEQKVVPVKLFNAMEFSFGESYERVTTAALADNTEEVYEAMHRILLLQEQQLKQRTHIVKTVQYYYFRYFANPENEYQVKWIMKGDLLAGVVFLKYYTNNGVKYGHLIEYLLNSELVTHDEMLGLVMELFEQSADKLAFWPVEKELADSLVSRSFRPTGFDTMFTLKFLDEDFREQYAAQLLDFDAWQLFMGDSDAF